MLHRVQYCYGKLYVRLSVALLYPDHIVLHFLKIITHKISLRGSLLMSGKEALIGEITGGIVFVTYLQFRIIHLLLCSECQTRI